MADPAPGRNSSFPNGRVGSIVPPKCIGAITTWAPLQHAGILCGNSGCLLFGASMLS